MKCFGFFAALLVLCPLVLGDSIDYQAAGNLKSHTAFTAGSIAAGRTWEVGARLLEIDNLTTGKITTGNLGIVDVSSGKLSLCSSGLCFTGGSLDIDNLAGSDLFFGKLLSGTISKSNGVTILTATLTNGATSVIKETSGTFSSQAITHGPGVVPEPTTLSLLGTGLFAIGFMFLKRRKEA